MRYIAIEYPAEPGTWSCHMVYDECVPCPACVSSAAYDAAEVLEAADYDTWEAYRVPGDHSNAGAASAAWAKVRMDDTNPKPIAKGQYRYDADGVAPVSVGVVMPDHVRETQRRCRD